MAEKYSNKYTKAALSDLKFEADIIERYHHIGGFRLDGFHFIDVLAMREDFGLLAVQATTPKKLSEQRKRLCASRECLLWVKFNKLHIWSWQHVGPPDRRMILPPYIEKVVLMDGVLMFVPIHGSELRLKP
jgi:hypothetical protein